MNFNLNKKNSAYVCASRFTHTMATISMPTIRQQNEILHVVEIESDNDVVSPIHEVLPDNEKSLTMNDLITPAAKEIDNSLLNESELKPSVIGVSSPVYNQTSS